MMLAGAYYRSGRAPVEIRRPERYRLRDVQLQFLPQVLATLPTQMLSQEFAQQYGSTAQMLATQLEAAGGTSQPEVSLTPVVQSVWPQVPCEAGHVRLLATLWTSPTQMLSQELLQQKGSVPQTLVATALHALASNPPVAHSSWAHGAGFSST
jgi:hypothetical protein